MYDLLLKNATVVRPGRPEEVADIAVTDGKFARIAPMIDAS